MMKRIIFICTGNSCRSQIAEGLMRDSAGENFDVLSAGTHPSKVHPAAIRVMKEWSIDIQNQKSESINNYLEKNIEIIITVCEKANQTCPSFPNRKSRIHWNIKDPFHSWDSEERDLAPYRIARNEIKKKINNLLIVENLNN
ncbi:arsenate reductase ArsC [Candidatus Marinimicrobia bacterium]|nr:arsenate reductase ArsC [Candidatus Neomarinimicrobiota bacterium]